MTDRRHSGRIHAILKYTESTVESGPVDLFLTSISGSAELVGAGTVQVGIITDVVPRVPHSDSSYAIMYLNTLL